MERAHAPCACSAAERWSECPGSVGLVAAVESEQPWVRAFPATPAPWLERGNRLHAAAAHILQQGLDQLPTIDRILERLFPDPLEEAEDADEQDEAFLEPEDGADHEEDREIVRLFCSEVRTAETFYGSRALIEQRVRPFLGQDIDGLCWGSLDAGVAARSLRILHVFDLKTGSGVQVTAWQNPQLTLYAGGMLRALGPDGFDRVSLTIVQPTGKGEPVKTYQASTTEVLEHVDKLGEKAREATRPDAELKVGPWCRFCPAIIRCPRARKDLHDLMAQLPDMRHRTITLTPEEAADVLRRWSALKPLRDAIYRAAHGFACTGRPIEGMTLEPRRRRRAWAGTEAEVARHLVGHLGMDPEDVYRKRLITPAQAETALKGKHKGLKNLIEAMVRWTTPGSNLVPIKSGEEPVTVPPPTVIIVPERARRLEADMQAFMIHKPASDQ